MDTVSRVARKVTHLFRRFQLLAQIHLRGSAKVVEIDGCHFDVSALPNTRMKLELLKGDYEDCERNALHFLRKKDLKVIELGGCIGVVACITNKLLLDPKAHVVVEANPIVIPVLEKYRQDNRCSFTIVNQALAYETAAISLHPSTDYWGTTLYNNNVNESGIQVSTTQLSKLLPSDAAEQFVLICDIEGQEYSLITHELETLKRAALIILELHQHLLGWEKSSKVISELIRSNFSIVAEFKDVLVFANNVSAGMSRE